VEAQGFNVEESMIFQDNLIAMLLERNGKKSNSKRTKHINIRYFFIKDRVASNEISIKHCPTAEMLADHFIKPLQGGSFRKFCAEIQGIPADMSNADLGWETVKKCETKQSKVSKITVSSRQECVGRPVKDTGLHANDAGPRKGYGITAHCHSIAIKMITIHNNRGSYLS
jgi:hypothetical protein